MSIEQPEVSNPSILENELTEQKLPSPFISEKKIRGHSEAVYDSTCATYPDGEDRIITCSFDCTIRIFNLEKQKCEKIIKHGIMIYSVHFYKEEQLLMTTDFKGELIIWKLFPEIRIIKKIKVAQLGSVLWNLTQISSTEFMCCVEGSNASKSDGFLFKIEYNNNNDNEFSSVEMKYPSLVNQDKELLNCIYQLISKKKTILFSGGDDEDYTIKSINLDYDNNNNKNNNNFQCFPKKHTLAVNCLTSYINSKNEEIILSGSEDERIHSWSVKGEHLREIKCDGVVDCFLNDFSRNRIIIAGKNQEEDGILCSFSLKTEKTKKNIENIQGHFNSLKWIDIVAQNRFISCSDDHSFSIYELEEILMEINIKKTYDCLREMSDCQIQYRNKKIKFWNIFANQISEINPKNGQIETNINEETLLSIVLGKEMKIPRNQLPDYYFFFKIMKLQHCIAYINREIEEIKNLEEAYILFKEFCLKYENDIIKSWFSLDLQEVQEVENIQRFTFETSFALSLFNKMKKFDTNKEGLKMLTKYKSFGTIWINLGKYKPEKMINVMSHKDFEGVEKVEELNVENYFKKLYNNRASNYNITLISTDKKEFRVYKEILILRFDFFFRLFNFRGLEVTEYEKTGKITLVDLMSSDVVECLISYAYLGEFKVNNEGISAINTFCKLLIFCDQFNEKKLMKKVHIGLRNFVNIYQSTEEKNENQNIFRNLYELSSYLVGNDKILGIIFPLIKKLGMKINGLDKFFKELFIQSLTVKEEIENKHNNEKMLLLEEKKKHEKEYEKKLLEEREEKKKLQERILELEELVGEMKEENDDEGVGKGKIREREENDEEDEEIKKEQPKRKKRKLNKK